MKDTFAPVRAYRHGREGSEIDRIFNNFMGGMFAPWAPALFREFQAEEALAPKIDLVSDDKAYTLKAELPGVEPDDVKLSVHDGVLEISGEKKEEKEDKRQHVSERRYGSFRRVMSLAEDADIEGIQAAHKNGVLTVTIPRKAQAPEKVISITRA